MVLLAVNGLVALTVAVLDLFGYSSVGALAEHTTGTAEESLDRILALSNVLSVVSIAVLMATAALFIVWLHRVRENAELFAPGTHQHGKGWVIGAWITPIACLWFPWRIVVDCWQASAPVTGPYGERRILSQRLVSSWWTAWIGALILNRITAAAVGAATVASGDIDADIAAVQTSLALEIAESVFTVAAAALAAQVVRRLSAMQDAPAGLTAPVTAGMTTS
ncbi:DUF4328 domain-containing protein [Kitasatospora sp. NPDC005748]|uniref:DUF4328 domain-containing protein n=1 Tax=Kitasatospora sp. NPDC005748 TaxID=3157063 RepID=UPI0033D4E9F7